MRKQITWLLAIGVVGLGSLSGLASEATPLFQPTFTLGGSTLGPYGDVGITALGGAGSYGVNSPVHVISDPVNPLAGNSLTDLGLEFDLGIHGVGCGGPGIMGCNYNVAFFDPAAAEEGLLFDFQGRVTVASVLFRQLNAPVDGYYWNGSGWTQFTNDLTTTGFLAAPVAHFQYLLFELDGNDQGL